MVRKKTKMLTEVETCRKCSWCPIHRLWAFTLLLHSSSPYDKLSLAGVWAQPPAGKARDLGSWCPWEHPSTYSQLVEKSPSYLASWAGVCGQPACMLCTLPEVHTGIEPHLSIVVALHWPLSFPCNFPTFLWVLSRITSQIHYLLQIPVPHIPTWDKQRWLGRVGLSFFSIDVNNL